VIQVVYWPLERSVFLQWRSSEGWEGGANKAVLFCPRNPEVTKTYLRYVAGFFERNEYPRGLEILAPKWSAACVFRETTMILPLQACSMASRANKSRQSLISRKHYWAATSRLSRASQIISQRCVKKGEMGSSGRGLRLVDLMRISKILISSLLRIFIRVDAWGNACGKEMPELLSC